MKYLFTVQDRFQIEGLGCVLVPGIPEDAPEVTRGAKIVLRKPCGGEIQTSIKATESIRVQPRPEKLHFPVVLPADITKEQVPNGTEVFLVDTSH